MRHLPSRRLVVGLAKTCGLTLALLGALAGWSVYEFGSVPSALAYASGDRLLADNPSKSFGRIGVGQSRTIEYIIQNRDATEVVVLGAGYSCTCAVAENLPLTLPAFGRRTLIVSFTDKKKKGGAVSETLSLYTNSHTKRALTLTVRGWVDAPATEPGKAALARKGVGK